MTGHVVVAEDLHRSYGDIRALDGLRLTVAAGSLTAVLGPNGAGKTTFLRQVCGLTPVETGRLEVLGSDVRHHRHTVLADLGVVFQESTLDTDLTVLENLVFHGRLFGLGRREARRRGLALLDRYQLADRAHERVQVLSGGQARRVELVRALLHEPRLLVLDEPTTGLDPHSRARFWADVREQVRGSGLTVLFSTHYLDETETADEIHIIVGGRRVTSGGPAELKAELGQGAVRLTTPEPARLTAVLTSLGLLAEPDGDGVLIRDHDPGAAVVRLCAVAGEHGIPVHRAGIMTSTLDEVFLATLGEGR